PSPSQETPRQIHAVSHRMRQRQQIAYPFSRRAGAQKQRMALLIRTIGIKRAEARITLANIIMKRLVFFERRALTG
ncbi:MAG: IS5/IS1182 family transposase, partial [Alphaproteobacteria bacterium]|nr:IS5/IS1182 family transposase [Alphaproteobacteria bacterium]